jgi:hypothetical protein
MLENDTADVEDVTQSEEEAAASEAPAAEEPPVVELVDEPTTKADLPRVKSRVSFIHGDVESSVPEDPPDDVEPRAELYQGMEPYPEGYEERRKPAEPLASQTAVIDGVEKCKHSLNLTQLR